jgi:hypothetical protein
MALITKHWKALLALIMLSALIIFMVFDWSRFLADFWPIDHSNVGPNLVASVVQYAIILIILALLYPPFRRAVEKFAKEHVKDIKEHISAEHDIFHEKLDHIIKHSNDIPEFVPSKERPKP